MEIFAAISAFIGIASLFYTIASGVDQAQETENTNKKQLELAQQQLNDNKEIANQNFDLSKEQFEYQKELNELTMKREDTAIQRQVADLKAAGLSPLMAAGGASASPLTSANAPQFDISGINTAMSNLMGAYNDAFTRKLNAKNFSLQARSQSAQMYTQIAESLRDQKQAQLEYRYLDKKLKWEEIHGFRDLDWKSELVQVIEDVLNNNRSSVVPDIINPDSRSDFIQDIKDKFDNLLNNNESNNINPPPVINNTENNEVTKQANKNQNKLKKEQEKNYKWSQNIIETRNPNLYGKDKDTTQAIDFIYRHTNAHLDYDTVYKFRNALIKDKKLAKEYILSE